jgi:hypothetical protein
MVAAPTEVATLLPFSRRTIRSGKRNASASCLTVFTSHLKN